MELTALVGNVQRRLRLGDTLAGAAAGLVLLALTVETARLAGGPLAKAAVAGALLALLVTWAGVQRSSRRWTAIATALHIEARTGGLDNLLVTATSLGAGALQASDRMRVEVARQAAERIDAVPLATVAPVRNAIALVLAAGVGALATTWGAFTRDHLPLRQSPVAQAVSIERVRATVVPPAYLGGWPRLLDDPDEITVPEGGQVRIEVQTTAEEAWVVEPGQPPRSLRSQPPGGFAAEWAPALSRGMVIAAGERVGEPAVTRVVNIVVVPDSAPRVRVSAPGHDLAFPDSNRVVDVAIDAADAEGLSGLRLAYVKMSGSGESFAFAEGQISVAAEQSSGREWHGRARLALASLKLEDGDTLVYRALARDSNPRGEWVESDAFTVDIGNRLEFASAGASVPGDDRRYALSQQMVIVKTERLQGERARLTAEAWAERTRLLAMEQRMVRAEVVFLSGGEVEDEVEEAERSNELQEGRLQNAGRAEMLRAINEMSRAEARLNAGDAASALVFERAALAALQRAFDRRRYFLRTLGERSRIDPTRRLTGDLAGAASSGRLPTRHPAPDVDLARQLMRELTAIDLTGGAPDPGVLGRLASVDSTSDEWRRLAAELAAAITADARRQVAERAMARVAEYARARAGASSPVPPVSELRGWWREEWRDGGRR